MNQWSQKETRAAIRATKGTRQNALAGKQVPLEKISPVPQPGKPGTYAGKLVIDLGLSNFISLSSVMFPRDFKKSMSSPNAFIGDPELDPRLRGNDKISKQLRTDDAFKEGDIITYENRFQPTRLKWLKTGQEDDLNTYKAHVFEVLDGDTVKAVIDLGFGITTTQTIRLKGIDAPEIMTRDGREAKKELEKMLKLGDSVEGIEDKKSKGLVLIKTVKSDKYDRYLGDIFVVQKDGSNLYLNNELLKTGNAVRVRE